MDTPKSKGDGFCAAEPNDYAAESNSFHEQLEHYLSNLEQQDKYKVIETIKLTPYEITEKVELTVFDGPPLTFIRKRIDSEKNRGDVYKILFDAQQYGRSFKYLPRIQEFCELNDKFCVVMEYVEGKTLDDIIYEQGPTLTNTVALFPEICKAVEELHTQFNPPLIHRDLKPTNIVVNNNQVKLIDFGISRVYQEGAEHDTQPFGTRSYASPEQFGFAQTSIKSDVYSLGMILYFMLTEKLPTPSLSGSDFNYQEIPADLRNVLKKATAFDPANRYLSVSLLLKDFMNCPSVKAELAAKTKEAAANEPATNLNTAAQTTSKLFSRDFPLPIKTIMHVWNYVVLVFLLVIYGAAIVSTVDPKPDSDVVQMSIFGRGLLYFGVSMIFTGIGWALIFKQVIPKRFGYLRLTLKQSWISAIAIFLAGVLLSMIAAMLFKP